jgi:Skp family chaperone for outer membrane proteins
MTRRVIGLVCLLLLVGGALFPVAAADFKVASIDMGKVTNSYTALQEKSRELQDWFMGQGTCLDRLADYLFLSAESFSEAKALLSAPQPLPEDKRKRLQELSDLAAREEDAFRALEAKPDRTAAENEAFKKMGDAFMAGQERLAGEQARLRAEYAQRVTTARDEFMKKVTEAADKIAKDEGYNLVLDSGVVLVGGTDITDKILAKLNS